MTKLPDARIVHYSMNQKRTLARWLHEWQIDKILHGADATRAIQESHDSMGESRKTGLLYDSRPVLAGQIRLFFPFSKETNERVRYVSVLKRNEEGLWLAAPFSRFREPAVPGEWRTGRKAFVLRVLCIWNARWLSGLVLGRSWVVDRMPLSRLDRVIAVHRFLEEGKEPSRQYANRIGPPLVHPLDPRIEYLEEEREWFSALSAKHTLYQSVDLSSVVLGKEDRSLPLAAEESGKYSVMKKTIKKRRRVDHSS